MSTTRFGSGGANAKNFDRIGVADPASEEESEVLLPEEADGEDNNVSSVSSRASSSRSSGIECGEAGGWGLAKEPLGEMSVGESLFSICRIVSPKIPSSNCFASDEGANSSIRLFNRVHNLASSIRPAKAAIYSQCKLARDTVQSAVLTSQFH